MPEPTRPSTGSGEFRLDVDLANQAVAKLEDVKQRLYTIKQEAHELGRETIEGRTAHDLISSEATRLLALKADGGPGSLSNALDEGIDYVAALIDQLKSDIAEVQGRDSSAAEGLARRG